MSVSRIKKTNKSSKRVSAGTPVLSRAYAYRRAVDYYLVLRGEVKTRGFYRGYFKSIGKLPMLVVDKITGQLLGMAVCGHSFNHQRVELTIHCFVPITDNAQLSILWPHPQLKNLSVFKTLINSLEIDGDYLMEVAKGRVPVSVGAHSSTACL